MDLSPEYSPEIDHLKIKGGEIVDHQYKQDIGLNVKLRWQVYKNATEPLDIIDDVIGASGIDNNAALLDVGCNDGEMLDRLRIAKHVGKLVGLDISQLPLSLGHQRQLRHSSDIQYANGTAENLPFITNSFDGALSLFTLYHVPDHQQALQEIKRVVKNDGTVIISTSGENNKMLHRAFEKAIAKSIGAEPPTMFCSGFTSEYASAILPKFFTINKKIDHITEMEITTRQQIYDYIGSLSSMRTAFNPAPASKQYNEILKGLQDKLINANNENSKFKLIDSIDRTYYICKNDK